MDGPPRRRMAHRRQLLPLALAAAIAAPATASACIEVGVYRDNPTAGMPQLRKAVGPGLSVISTYVSFKDRVDPKVIALAKANKAKLMVTLMADGGRNGALQPSYSNARVAAGRYDARVRTLARQLKASGLAVILRPMPEPNTPWYPWSGTENGNSAQTYVAAWNRIRRVVKLHGGKKVKLLWAPYMRSVPDTDDNAIDLYFPGNASVDLVGVSGYNFGAVNELEWLSPVEVFQDPYIEIQNLSKKPFWIAETGSTAKGGDKSLWLRNLAKLQKSLPRLRGVVLYDVREPSGDFRITATPKLKAATKALLATRCGKR